jgi:transketolase
MAQYAGCPLNVVGSHCGVSIGQDGASQMSLEDIAMFRSISNSVVLYPADGVSTCKLIDLMIKRSKGLDGRDGLDGAEGGVNYLRLTRDRTGLEDVYKSDQEFRIGGSNRLTDWYDIAVIGAGVTLTQAIAVNKILPITVIDCYSVKPIDEEMLAEVSQKCKHLIVVEDHHQQGGIYEAVMASGKMTIPVHSLAVRVTPKSGTKEELLRYCKIDKDAILEVITSIY